MQNQGNHFEDFLCQALMFHILDLAQFVFRGI